MEYKILNGQDNQPCGVTIVGQNIFIPMSDNNADYKDYLKWLEEGNTPQPAEKVDEQ